MKKNTIKKTLITLAVTLVVALYTYIQNAPTLTGTLQRSSDATEQLIHDAYVNRRSNIQVSGSGVVIKVLPDDQHGSRHQRFILKLPSGQKLLVAHNIDLAKKIASLRQGDIVEFNGEYEYNDKGGVIHWTHHDPNGRHAHGWLRHKGKTYE